MAAKIVPIAAVLAFLGAWERSLPVIGEIVVVGLLGASVLAAVHHAEVVAHRVGEPFGSLILAVAVTVIEVGLIVTLMVSGGPGAATLARDTVFAAVMITCNGILGLSLLITALREGTAPFNAKGTGAALATVITLATLSLVLPTFTTSVPGPEFSGVQLAFAAVVSLALYVLFVFVQNVRHRDYFLPAPGPTVRPLRPSTAGGPGGVLVAERTEEDQEADTEVHAATPSLRTALTSLALLVTALVAVVGLAKVESKTIEAAVSGAGLPHAVVGVVIALLVLLPETLAAARNAQRRRTQISLNLALGSAMASIGLTIPTIAVASIWLDGPLLLGLGSVHIVLLGLTALVGTLTVIPGRATLLQAGVHLTLCASYLFLAAVP
ncbi:ionic transporter y4hA [Nonomuraea aridisoli]|uniref:Ionic transporter y4hA n=2 Tax=Nonomuraea aridisoli TaxID=2070368 RepID=A0A2W2DC88_9ACTN|nr:ionic transporter y4hA [Nonomuraea aridisoli]